MKIRSKLILSFTAIASLVVVVGLAGMRANKNISATYEIVAGHSLRAAMLLQDMRYYAMRIINASTQIALLDVGFKRHGIDVRDEFDNELHELQKTGLEPFNYALEHYRKLVQTNFPDEIGLVDDIARSALDLHNTANELLAMVKAGAAEKDILEFNEKLEKHEEEIVLALDDALDHERRELLENNKKVEDAIIAAGRTLTAAGTLVFTLALFAGLFIARSLSTPVRRLAATAATLGTGDFSARASIDSRDEIGALAAEFNNMAERLARTTVSKEHVDNILKSVPDALFVLDSAHNIMRVNTIACTMFGHQAHELIGQPFGRLVDDPRLIKKVQAALATQDSMSGVESRLLTKDGGDIEVSISAARLGLAAPPNCGLVLVAQDVTQRNRAREVLIEKTQELERSNKELDQFAYVTSHDLKAPLRAIANLSQWIEEDAGDALKGEVREHFDTMRGRVHRMEALIDGILQYSRVGRTQVDISSVDTASMLHEIIDSLAKPEGFNITIQDGMPIFTTARVRLQQVFSNLIGNAIKYHDRPDGHVTVSVQDAGKYYEFAVSDDGPGIAPQYHEKIFVIFQTLTARDKKESTGIGLTIVKKIVEEQGGAIRLESEEGKGATFRFTWPKQLKEQGQ